MLRFRVLLPEFLLHLLQRLNKCSNQIRQIQCMLITNGHLLITKGWMNTLLYNTLIRAHLNVSQPCTSLILFIRMLRDQGPPNGHTFPSLLKATSSLTHPYSVSSVGCSYHGQCVRRGLSNNQFVQTAFISLYSQVGDMRGMQNMFKEIFQPCIGSYNAMLTGFGRVGIMDSAVSMFLNMPDRDVYSWTSLMNGYVRNGRFLFRNMMVDECALDGVLKPNEATLVTVLSACANLDDGYVDLGRQIHCYLYRIEELMSVNVGTALIAFYGKTGCLDSTIKLFNATVVKRVSSWNAVISSLALNGRERLALHMFEVMKGSGFHPNEVTFVGVLSACARVKMVELGLELFRSMTRDFGVIPTMEHYGCVVDLFGRAGLLEEAYEFIKSMPFEADGSVWGALLSGCRVHGAVELGHEAGKQVLELQPQHCGRYVLLSSIFAGAELWDHAAEWRKAMIHAGIHKVPAFSMTE